MPAVGKPGETLKNFNEYIEKYSKGLNDDGKRKNGGNRGFEIFLYVKNERATLVIYSVG